MSLVRNVGIYARISDDREGSGLGVARQEADCRALADTRGWTVTDVYTDNDISAFRKKRRPSYERLLADLRARRINGVVTYHTSRLHRRLAELETFIDVLNDADATFAAVQAGDIDLTTSSGRMIARMLAVIARHEAEQMSERLRRKHLELAHAGKIGSGGGCRPYGFEEDRVTIRWSEAEIIREMADRVVAGDTIRSIVMDLNRRGVTTSAGKEWLVTTARRTLVAGRVAGLREHLGEIAATATWDPILDRATWETVRAILTDPSRRMNHHPRRYLLTGGLSVCGLCQAKLVARPKDDGRRCYVCASGAGFGGCGKIRVLADPLEEWVIEAVLDALDGGGLQRAMAAEHGDTDPDVAGELATVERRLDELSTMFGDGLIDRRGWLVARGRLEGRRDDLARMLAGRGRRSSLSRLAGPGGVRARWARIEDFDTRRAVLASAFDRVAVGPAVKGRNFFDVERMLAPKGWIDWRV